MSSRVDSLVAINDMLMNDLESQEQELTAKANVISDALCQVISSTFDRPVKEIPLRFAKYFLNVVHKICCTKAVTKALEEETLENLCEQVLEKMLIKDLVQLGDKGEGEAMHKTLNGVMLRLL